MSHPHSTTRRLRKVGGAITAIALGCSAAAFVPLSAQASSVSTATGSYAEGQFLSGSLAGVDLDEIVALQSAQARNTGSGGTKEVKDPLTASVLRSVLLTSPNGVQLGLGSIIDAGALSQYARAENGGTSLGASGAVGNSGAIGVGATGDGDGGDLTVDLDSLLNSRFANVITDLKLQVRAVAAQASGSPDAVSGKYSLAGLKLAFTSPALASVNDKVSSSLDSATGSLDGLSGPNAAIAGGVNGLLTGINPVLSAVGSSATVKASVTSDLRASVQPLLTSTYTTPGITLNLKTGSVVVDLEKLLGGSLNSKAAGTEVLSDAVVNEILNAITKQVSSLADQIKNRVSVSLHGAKVDVDIEVNALTTTPGSPAVPGTPATPAVPGLPALPAIPAVPAVLCSVLDVLHLCTPTPGTAAVPGRAAIPGIPAIPALPGIPAVPAKTLASTAGVHVHGTVDQILAGTAGQATTSVSLLGGTVKANLDSQAVLGSIANSLTDRLFDGDGAMSHLVDRLDTTLVNPAVTALFGPGDTSVQKALAGLLSVKLNVKETRLGGTQGMAVASGTVFTETALRISVLKDLGQSSLATLNLAQASVGPQVAVVVDPGGPSTGPTPPTDGPGTPTTGDNPGGHSSPTAAHFSSLASTGVGIATIVAILLALLAAGAYLAREGYRRKHMTEK